MSDELPVWHCVCGYSNVGGICTKCGAIPKPPTIQPAIVVTLFKALATAAKKPACFEIECRNPAGMQGLAVLGLAVLVIDANAFSRLILPILDHLKLTPEDLSA